MPQQGGANDRFRIGAALLQVFGVQTVAAGQPQRGVHAAGNVAAALKLGAVVGMAAQRPARQQRCLRLVAAVQCKVRAVGQRNQPAQQVRPGLGARQQRMRTQQLRRCSQVAAAFLLQVQADQVDHARTRFFQFGTQKLAAKVARYLHDALGGFFVDGSQRGGVQDAVLQPVGQRFFKKSTAVVQRQCGRRRRHCRTQPEHRPGGRRIGIPARSSRGSRLV